MSKYGRFGFLLLILNIVILSSFAQERQIIKVKKYKTVSIIRHPAQEWPVELGFVTPLGLHSGGYLGMDYVYKERYRVVDSRRFFLRMGVLSPHKKGNLNKKTKSVFRVLQPQLMIYNQKQFHTGMNLQVQGIYRVTRNKGFQYQAGMGLGYLRTWYHGSTWVAKDDGSFKEKKIAGRGYFAPSFSLAFGWDMHQWKRLHNPGQLRFTLSTIFPAPWNASIGMLAFSGVGYHFTIPAVTKKMKGLGNP